MTGWSSDAGSVTASALSLAVILVSSGARTQSGAAFQTQAGLVLVRLRQGAGARGAFVMPLVPIEERGSVVSQREKV